MAERCDLVVVGAGPAGASAATAYLHRRPDAHVVLLDRAAFPRDKACGDAIAAHAFAELARLGVHDVEGDADPVWDLHLTAPDGSLVVGRCTRPNRIIPREVFDGRLVEAAVGAGADLRRHRVRQVTVDGGGVTVDGLLRAPILIAADGASSVVRHRLGIPGPSGRHRAVAVRAYASGAAHTDDPHEQPAQHIAFLAPGWPAYAWSFPLDSGRANIGYGLRTSELTGDGRALLHRRLAEALPACVVEEGTVRVHPLPLSTGRPVPGHGRVLLTGDAAGLINPLTGEGIFYAIASGRLAAIAAAGGGEDPGGRYIALMRRRFGRHFATTSVLARLLDRRWLLPVAITAARDPGVFRDVAEIGLGEGTLTPRLARALALAGAGQVWRQRPR